MNTNKNNVTTPPVNSDFVELLWNKSWTYIKTVVDVVREPVLILDRDLQVMAANDSFYRTFQAELQDTEKKNVFELGNGQWNIPALRKLLEDILPKNTFFKGFEVDHEFPFIGRKIMILNAREIHFKEDVSSRLFPSIILLAIEDVTEMMMVAETLASHSKQTATRLIERTQNLENQIKGLEKQVLALRTNKSNV